MTLAATAPPTSGTGFPPFRPAASVAPRGGVDRDFARMSESGINAVRVYTMLRAGSPGAPPAGAIRNLVDAPTHQVSNKLPA